MPRSFVSLALALGLVLVGCGHAAPPAPTPAVATPDPCAEVADHVVSLMSAAQKVKNEQLDPFRNVIDRRCAQDGWSAEARQCLLEIHTLAEGDRCDAQLTPAQRQALDRDGRAALAQLQGAGSGQPAPTAESPASAATQSAPAPATTSPAPAPSAAPAAPSPAPAAPAGETSADPCEGGE